MDNIDIKITWDGTDWKVESEPPSSGLTPGFSAAFTMTIPAPNDVGVIMFPMGTTLFLALADGEESSELAPIFEAFWKRQPFLSLRPSKLLVPIHLDESLRLRPSRKLYDCTCRIEGFDRIFNSLNQASSWCIDRWTNRQGNAVNVFQAVYFVEQKRLVSLHHQRDYVLSGTPLPASIEIEQAQFLPGIDPHA
jgi:hypothetical protein